MECGVLFLFLVELKTFPDAQTHAFYFTPFFLFPITHCLYPSFLDILILHSRAFLHCVRVVVKPTSLSVCSGKNKVILKRISNFLWHERYGFFRNLINYQAFFDPERRLWGSSFDRDRSFFKNLFDFISCYGKFFCKEYIKALVLFIRQKAESILHPEVLFLCLILRGLYHP